MKDSRKEFIRQAHKYACSEWKEKIEKEFPKLFKEDALVVGKWYKNINKIESIICYNSLSKSNLNYGLNNRGNWTNYYGLLKDEMIIATDKEVEEALIKEAKKRGFKKGCVIKHNKEAHPSLNDNEDICNDTFYFSVTENFLTIYGWEIFTDGKWATIVETITKEQAEKELGKTILN